MSLPTSVGVSVPKARAQVVGIPVRAHRRCHAVGSHRLTRGGNLRSSGVLRSASRDVILPRDIRPHVAATRSPETAKEGWWLRDSAENMVDIKNLKELMTELEGARDRLVIVDFYAYWCNSCRALYPKLCKLARSYPEVLFLKVNWADNKALCKSLGIKALPYFHFYRGAEGRVEAFSASITKFKRLKDAIDLHSTPRCSLGPSVSHKELFGFSEATPKSPMKTTRVQNTDNFVNEPRSPRESFAGAVA